MFLQIAVPSRTDVKEYQDLKEEIDKLVGMINGKFSTSKWSPVRYIFGQVNQVSSKRSYYTYKMLRDSKVRFSLNFDLFLNGEYIQIKYLKFMEFTEYSGMN